MGNLNVTQYGQDECQSGQHEWPSVWSAWKSLWQHRKPTCKCHLIYYGQPKCHSL